MPPKTICAGVITTAPIAAPVILGGITCPLARKSPVATGTYSALEPAMISSAPQFNAFAAARSAAIGRSRKARCACGSPVIPMVTLATMHRHMMQDARLVRGPVHRENQRDRRRRVGHRLCTEHQSVPYRQRGRASAGRLAADVDRHARDFRPSIGRPHLMLAVLYPAIVRRARGRAVRDGPKRPEGGERIDRTGVRQEVVIRDAHSL